MLWFYVCCSSILLELLCDLISSSIHVQQEILQTKGFLVISYLLEKVRRFTDCISIYFKKKNLR